MKLQLSCEYQDFSQISFVNRMKKSALTTKIDELGLTVGKSMVDHLKRDLLKQIRRAPGVPSLSFEQLRQLENEVVRTEEYVRAINDAAQESYNERISAVDSLATHQMRRMKNLKSQLDDYLNSVSLIDIRDHRIVGVWKILASMHVEVGRCCDFDYVTQHLGRLETAYFILEKVVAKLRDFEKELGQ